MNGSGRISSEVLAGRAGFILAFSVLIQVLFFRFVLNVPYNTQNSAELYLGLLSLSAATITLYMLSYFLVYRRLRRDHEKHVALVALVLGAVCMYFISFAPLGISLLVVAFLVSRNDRGGTRKIYVEPPKQVEFIEVLDQGNNTPFTRLRRGKRMALYSRVLAIATYSFLLLEFLINGGLFHPLYSPSPVFPAELIYLGIAPFLLSLAVAGLDSVFTGEPLKKAYKFLPGRSGHITSSRSGAGNYHVKVEGVRFNARSSSGILKGTQVSVRKVVVNANPIKSVLYVEPTLPS